MTFVYHLVIHLESEKIAKEAFNIFQNTEQSILNNTREDKQANNRPTEITDNRIHKYSIITALKDKENTKIKMDTEKDKVISEYLGHGIIRLFREIDEPRTNETIQIDEGETNLTVPGDDTMVCILFVPTYFTVHDLLHFYIGDDIVNNQISNFRILQNHDAGVGFNFMVLMKFKDPRNAKIFQETFNGKKFSKIDPERCHVVFIKEVTFKSNLFERDSDKSLPYLLTDPFTKLNNPNGPVELPMCPVCLERMDSETTGLITIPCQHTFHCYCLDAWKNSKCPVCRYSSFRLARDSLIKQAGNSPKCTTCGCNENLWICLICGNIGCGRYNSKHAIQHYDDTSHCFAMDIRTQRVWDYAGDNYVHRIVQNEVDGKLVEVSGNVSAGALNNDMVEGSSSTPVSTTTTTQQGRGTNGIKNKSNDKDLDLAENFLRNKEYHLEYVQVLISQLESQREYYEDKLKTAFDMAQELSSNVTRLEKATSSEGLEKRISILENNYDTKIDHYQRLVLEQNEMLDGMSKNLEVEKKKINEMNKINIELMEKNKKLQEENNDLMFYIKARDQFANATEEEINGTVVMQPGAGAVSTSGAITSNGTKTKKKRKKKNKK